MANRLTEVLYGALLCPAGHLPHEGGDWISPRLSPITNVAEQAPRAKLPISPLVGEMAGSPEGGAVERGLAGLDPVRT
ncbi:hypothetical protein FJ955_15495 [Mesorhizobium sp. B2-2-2]|nr:hypothetical protein FJ955_15495 [Mesorhizobium sp. B2-2-2]